MSMFVSTYLHIIQTNFLQKQPTNTSKEMNIGCVQSCPAENGKTTYFQLSWPCGCNPPMPLEELWLTLPKAGRALISPCPVEDGDVTDPATDPACSDFRTHLSPVRDHSCCFKKVLQVKKTSGRHHLQQGPN